MKFSDLLTLLREKYIHHNQEVYFEVKGTTPDGKSENFPLGINKIIRNDKEEVTIIFEDI